jgi:hypothetical protein
VPKPLSELSGPLLGSLGVAVSPTGGQGLALDELGRVSPSLLTGFPTDASKVLKGDGSWAVQVTKGSASLVLTAAASASVAVTHNFGSTPTAVLITSGTSPVSGGTSVELYVTGIGATQFTVNGATANGGAVTVTLTIYWLAA